MFVQRSQIMYFNHKYQFKTELIILSSLASYRWFFFCWRIFNDFFLFFFSPHYVICLYCSLPIDFIDLLSSKLVGDYELQKEQKLSRNKVSAELVTVFFTHCFVMNYFIYIYIYLYIIYYVYPISHYSHWHWVFVVTIEN